MENLHTIKPMRKHMSNPKNFCQEAAKHGIIYEFLIEAKESINCTNLARMFMGKSSRGGLSADTIETWIATFEYVKNHPDEEDNDQYTARRFEPTQEYHDYVKILKIPITNEVVESWKNMTNSALGKIAPNYGYKIGISNSISIKTLKERMLNMVERRKNNIWNKNYDNIVTEDTKPNYRLMNVPDLRKLCKDRNLHNAHIKTKDGLISLLERNPFDSVYDDNKVNYNKMNMKELKKLAKDRGFTSYNNLKKDELIKNHIDFDELENENENKPNDNNFNIDDGFEESKLNKNEEINQIISEENIELCITEHNIMLKNGKDCLIPIRKDGMINATELCKAGGKKFNHYHNLKQTQEFIKELEKSENIPESKLIIVKHGGISESVNLNSLNPKIQGTWIHRKVAYNLAQWISPYFAVQVSKILDELFTKGEVKLQRPVRKLLDLSEIDIEAEELEMKHDWSLYTNKCVLYIAYIGKSLVKLGYSDCNIHQREKKHTNCESQYEQFRMIKAFEISGEPIEKKIKELLSVYNVKFHNQSEIFKPPSTLNNFIETIETLLRDNDLKITLELVQKENTKLKLRISELEKENLELRLK